jgi:high frequency lysogenization protein
VQALMEVDRSAGGAQASEIGYIVDSILTLEATNLRDVFPDPRPYAPGVELALQALASGRDHLQIIKYTLGVLELVRLLKSDREILQRLGNMLAPMSAGTIDPDQLYPIGNVYQQTISRLGKRIQVVGNPSALQEPATAARIRTLLLAAVRFIWLWDQLGGRRWHFVVRRRAMLLALSELKTELTETEPKVTGLKET